MYLHHLLLNLNSNVPTIGASGAIAGVMGGADSAIDENSQDIVLEAAHFTRKSAAGKARRYGLHTESSHRFERGVDPQLAPIAMQRATALVLEICGGQAGQVIERSNEHGLLGKPAVTIRLSRLQSLLGMQLEHAEVAGILHRIADSVVQDEGAWSVKPPSYRFDIEREADLVEEVARVKGYDNIPTALPRIAPRSITASVFSATLELTRDGDFDVRQDAHFGPLYLRNKVQPTQGIAP